MSGKELVRWTWIPVVIVFAYAAWVLYSRQAENKRIEEKAVQERAAEDQKVLEKLGSGRLKILMFYANPPVVSRGEKTLLCYGVSNATTVRIEPDVEGVGPAISRCVEAAPRSDTTYTLTAEGANASKETGTVSVRVQ
jgi:hypothetical protein